MYVDLYMQKCDDDNLKSCFRDAKEYSVSTSKVPTSIFPRDAFFFVHCSTRVQVPVITFE